MSMSKKAKKKGSWRVRTITILKVCISSLLLFSGYQIYLHDAHTKPQANMYTSKSGNRFLHHDKNNFVTSRGSSSSKLKLKPSFAIFYNAFVNPLNYNASLRIISEQLGQVQNSSHHNTPIFYNLIGHYVPESMICPSTLNCKQIRYIPDGEEVTTLQDLFEYCQEHPLDAVVYLHDKGSFNPSGNNHRIRRLATVSAISQACRDSLSGQKCNLCVNKFMLLPNHHTPGAMWTGNCSYLSTLIPPKDFDAKRQEMFRAVRENQTLQRDLYCVKALVDNFEDGQAFNGDQWKYMSIFRYAMEHWAFSGPLLEPCVTVPGKIMGINPMKWKPNVTLGTGKSNLDYERATATGWYQEEGRKFEMQYLYGRLPAKSSFFYDVYRNAKVSNAQKLKCY